MRTSFAAPTSSPSLHLPQLRAGLPKPRFWSALVLAVLFPALAVAQSVLSSLTGINGPTFVAIDANRAIAGTTATWLYVSEHGATNNTGGGRILRFNLTSGSTTPTVVATAGTGNGQFTSPDAILVDAASGDLIVADRALDRIQRITNAGAFVMKWGSGTAGAADEMHGPAGLARDASGAIYVTEHGETLSSPPGSAGSFVSKYTISGSTATRAWRVGGVGSSSGQFANPGPYGIVVSGSSVLVADGFNSRVVTLDASGVVQSQFATTGAVPLGLYLDPSGALWIAETSSNGTGPLEQVEKRTIAGATTGVTLSGGLSLPFDVAIDSAANRAYVADYNNNRIAVWDLGATSGTTGGTTGGTTTTAVAPTITSFAIDLTTATATHAEAVVTFSTAVTGVDVTDFAANGQGTAAATLTGVTGSGTTYRVGFDYTGSSGSLQIGIKTSGTGIVDSAGTAFRGGGATATAAITVNNSAPSDETLPTVTSFTGGTPSATSVSFSIVFSEAVTGVDAADFYATTTGGATASIGTVTGSGTTYTVPVTFTGSGTIQLTAIGGVTANIRDAATNWFAGGGTATSATVNVGSSTGGGGTTSAPTISNQTATGTVGVTLNYQISATGAASYKVSSGTLPAGLTLNGTTGSVTGTPTAATPAGGTAVTVQVTNSAGSASAVVTFTIAAAGTGGGGTTGGTGGTTAGTHVTGITPPAAGTYVAGQSLTFTIAFNGNVTVSSKPTVIASDSKSDDGPADKNDQGSKPTKGSGDNGDDASKSGTDDGKQIQSPTPPPATTSTSTGSSATTTVPATNTNGDDENDQDAAPFFTWSAAGTTGLTHAVTYVSGSGTSTLTFRYEIKKDDSAPTGLALGTTIQLPAGTSILDAAKKPLDAVALKLPWSQNPLTSVMIASAAVVKSAESIQIHVGPGLVVGEAITLPATTGSGAPITWVLVSGNATLNGNVVTPKNKGTIVLRALVGGNAVTVSAGSAAPSAAGNMTFDVVETHNDKLVNLSSRLRVHGGDATHAVFAGFVVNGTAPKTVLIRAVGPGLAAFGITDALSAPRLQVRNAQGAMLADNSGWNNDASVAAASTRVGAFALSAGSHDAAVLLSLAPGAYTAQVSAANAGADGIALLEIYDAATGSSLTSDQLVNISTRGFVDTGDGQLMAGFVVSGDTPKRILVRGIGPALAAFGMTGTLADPVLQIFAAGSSAPVASNDDWETPQSVAAGSPAATAAEITAAAAATGAFPLTAHAKDAALLLTLAPGTYSAVLSGSAGSTGAGLIEVYEVPTK